MKNFTTLFLLVLLSQSMMAQDKYVMNIKLKDNTQKTIPVESLDTWGFEKVSEETSSPSVETVTDSQLNGKSIMFIGDSYVANHQESYTNTWQYLFVQKYSMNYINRGVNGSVWTDQTDAGSITARLDTITVSADYVITIGGRNDYNRQIPIETFKTGLKSYCEKLTQKYPLAKLAFFTPWRISADGVSNDANDIKQQEYIEAIKEVGAMYCIPVFDAGRNGGIRAYNKAFREEYFQKHWAYGVTYEYSHLNSKGHKYFLPAAEAFIKGL